MHLDGSTNPEGHWIEGYWVKDDDYKVQNGKLLGYSNMAAHLGYLEGAQKDQALSCYKDADPKQLSHQGYDPVASFRAKKLCEANFYVEKIAAATSQVEGKALNINYAKTWSTMLVLNPKLAEVKDLFESVPSMLAYLPNGRPKEVDQEHEKFEKDFKIFGSLDIIKMLIDRVVYPIAGTEQKGSNGEKRMGNNMKAFAAKPFILKAKDSITVLFGQIQEQARRLQGIGRKLVLQTAAGAKKTVDGGLKCSFTLEEGEFDANG